MVVSRNTQMGPRLALAVLALAGAAFLALAGALFAAEGWLPYARIREHLAASSNLAGAAFFTESYYAGAICRATQAGFFCLASALGLLGAWVWIRCRAPAENGGEARGGGWAAPGGAVRRRLADRAFWTIVVLSAVLRLPFLFQPGSSDEVRGYYAWTARPFWLAVSDYRAPQHLLYTLLDYPVVRLLGNGEWAIRLPAFAAGILLPALVFLAGRRWFGRHAGWLAAALVAANPLFVHFSVNGRAYTLQACLVVWLWLAAARLAERPGAGARIGLTLAGAGGLIALPTMVYPLVGTYLWLLWSHGRSRRAAPGAWKRNVGWLVLCGAATIWLAALAYLPAYVASDRWYSVDADDVSVPVSWGRLPARLAGFLVGAYCTWNEDVPAPLAGVLLAFGIAGAVRERRNPRFHLLVFNLLAILGVSAVLRIVPYVRTALYFGMAYFLVAGTGLARALEGFRGRRGDAAAARRAAALGTALLLLILGGNLAVQNRHGFTAMGLPAPGVRALMADLKDRLRPGDHLVCAKPTSGPLYYYHLRHGLECRLWFIPEEYPPEAILASSQAVIVVVNDYGGQTLENVLDASGWSAAAIRAHRFVMVGSNRFASAYRRE